MFLPDRYIKGECPRCGAKDQYGDTCEVCGAVYAPDRAEEPVLDADRRDAGAASSASTTSSSSRPTALRRLPAALDAAAGRLQPEVPNKISEWSRRARRRRPGRLGHQPRRAVLRHRDPRCAGQVLLRLARRADRLPRVAEELLARKTRHRLRRASSTPTPTSSRCTSSARTSSTSTRCSGRRCCTSAAARRRPGLRARLHHRQRREDEQEPRHRHRRRCKYLELGMNAEWLRYYIAAKLNAQGRGRRLQSRRLRRARQQRPDRQVRQHREPRGGLPRASASTARAGARSSCRRRRALLDALRRAARDIAARCTTSASSARRCARSCCWPTGSTSTSTRTSRGSWPSRPAQDAPPARGVHALHRGLPAAHAST